MDYETKMLLWNISKQTEVANAIKLGEEGCTYKYTTDSNDGNEFLHIHRAYAPTHVHCPYRKNWSVENAMNVAKYWDQNKPKPP